MRACVRDVKLSEDAFHPKPKESWGRLEKIVGYNSEPTWYHPGARNQNDSYADIFWMQVAFTRAVAPRVQPSLVAAALFGIEHMLVSFKDSNKWSLPVGRLSDLSYAGWPADRHDFPGSSVHWFELRSAPGMSYDPVTNMLHMFDLGDWKAVTIEFWSPMHQATEIGSALLEPRIRAVQVSEVFVVKMVPHPPL